MQLRSKRKREDELEQDEGLDGFWDGLPSLNEAGEREYGAGNSEESQSSQADAGKSKKPRTTTREQKENTAVDFWGELSSINEAGEDDHADSVNPDSISLQHEASGSILDSATLNQFDIMTAALIWGYDRLLQGSSLSHSVVTPSVTQPSSVLSSAATSHVPATFPSPSRVPSTVSSSAAVRSALGSHGMPPRSFVSTVQQAASVVSSQNAARAVVSAGISSNSVSNTPSPQTCEQFFAEFSQRKEYKTYLQSLKKHNLDANLTPWEKEKIFSTLEQCLGRNNANYVTHLVNGGDFKDHTIARLKTSISTRGSVSSEYYPVALHTLYILQSFPKFNRRYRTRLTDNLDYLEVNKACFQSPEARFGLK